MSEEKSILTAAEVARWLHVSEVWVRQHASGLRRPVLPSVKLGKCRRFRREAIERWLEQQERVA